MAVRELAGLGTIHAVSRVYESLPADGSDQPNYLNAAVLLETDLSAEELCRTELPAIEAKLGRVRDSQDRNAARTIDLDLALYDASVLQVDHRWIPDPDILVRPFLAVPLAELDGTYCHPQTGSTLEDIAIRLRTSGMLAPRPDITLKFG